jgi:hypothetical protein
VLEIGLHNTLHNTIQHNIKTQHNTTQHKTQSRPCHSSVNNFDRELIIVTLRWALLPTRPCLFEIPVPTICVAEISQKDVDKNFCSVSTKMAICEWNLVCRTKQLLQSQPDAAKSRIERGYV